MKLTKGQLDAIELASLLKIEDYYNKTLQYLQQNDIKSALYIIHNEMPVDLYDKSLDIMDNRNDKNSNDKLKNLIQTVDNLLYKESDIDEESNLDDLFKDCVF